MKRLQLLPLILVAASAAYCHAIDHSGSVRIVNVTYSEFLKAEGAVSAYEVAASENARAMRAAMRAWRTAPTDAAATSHAVKILELTGNEGRLQEKLTDAQAKKTQAQRTYRNAKSQLRTDHTYSRQVQAKVRVKAARTKLTPELRTIRSMRGGPGPMMGPWGIIVFPLYDSIMQPLRDEITPEPPMGLLLSKVEYPAHDFYVEVMWIPTAYEHAEVVEADETNLDMVLFFIDAFEP